MIGIFLYDRFQLLDASGPITAFEIAARMADDAYRLVIVSLGGGAVTSSAGVALATVAAGAAGPLDTLLVAGGDGSREALHCADSLAWLRARAADVHRLGSVYSGAFLLAAAGLLDGRRAATHWRRAAELQRRFPCVRVEPDHIHLRDGYRSQLSRRQRSKLVDDRRGAWVRRRPMATYRRWQEAGTHVRRGEKAIAVVFWQRTDTKEEAEAIDRAERHVPLIARASSVFNADQVEG